jgi:putative phage-type endonuclease
MMSDLLLREDLEVVGLAGVERDDWLDLRRTGVGGSDVGSIVGVNRWKSSYQVWLEKTGRLPDEDLSDRDAVHFGNVLEGAVADRFAYRTGFDVWNPKAMFRDRARPWRLATPDRLMLDVDRVLGVLEVKTAGHYAGDDWADGKVPETYELQGAHYAGLLGLPYCYFAVLIGGQRLEWRRVDVDADYAADVADVVDRFWHDHVLTDDPPPPDGSAACTDVLNRLWDPEESTVNLGREALIWAREYLDAGRERNVVEARKVLAANRLRTLLAEHTVGLVDGAKVATWRPVETRRFDSKAFAVDHPDLFEKYRTTSTSRTLRVPASINAKETD